MVDFWCQVPRGWCSAAAFGRGLLSLFLYCLFLLLLLLLLLAQGDSVNLAARLMQRAVSEDGGVMCELATKRACGGLLQFKGRGDFRIKVTGEDLV